MRTREIDLKRDNEIYFKYEVFKQPLDTCYRKYISGPAVLGSTDIVWNVKTHMKGNEEE